MSPVESPLLSVAGLEVRFGHDAPAVRQVDLAVRSGQTVAIVGESGSGKSTDRRGDSGAACARWTNHRGPRRVRWRRPHRRRRPAAPIYPRGRHRLRTTGPDDQPEPSVAGGLSDTRSVVCQQSRCGQTTAVQLLADAGMPDPATQGPAVSPSAVRRDVPACADCHRAGRPSAAADRRRADLSAGRHRAAPGARSPAASDRRIGNRGAVDHP